MSKLIFIIFHDKTESPTAAQVEANKYVPDMEQEKVDMFIGLNSENFKQALLPSSVAVFTFFCFFGLAGSKALDMFDKIDFRHRVLGMRHYKSNHRSRPTGIYSSIPLQ